MSLRVIAGPPGSGRGEELEAAFAAALDREPLLIAPTSDDVDRLERDLCAAPGGILGGTITSFPGLFGEVARAVGLDAGEPLTEIQRIWLAREAARRTSLRMLARSSYRAGFAPALAALLDDLQAAGLDAAGLEAAANAAGAGDYEREIVALFAAYERLRDAGGAADEHQLAAAATAALRAAPAAWQARPVFLYGFDDLTREQVELVGALAAATEVVVTATFEDRQALAARAELLGILRDELGATVSERAPSAAGSGSVLHHLERNLFEPDSERVEPDGSLQLLEAAGEHGEAELIGRKVARLLADGVDPDEVAIVVRAPDRQAPLIARTLGRMGIPLAPEASVPLAATATGASLLELIEIAAGEGSAATVVSFLRRPGRARPGPVDWLERRVRRERLRTADEALEAWAGDFDEPRRIWSLDDLRAAGEEPAAIARVLARTAADVAERDHARSGIVPSGGAAVELRAAGEAARALADVVDLGEPAPRSLAGFAELLAHVRVPLWRGPTEGRVRILSPYRLRATRVAHLFVAGLADGSFPAAAGGDPLLSDERRRALGLPARTDPAAEERYLFYTCVAKPERRLHLSYPASDEAGGEAPRSPFVDEVRDLLDPAPTALAGDDPLETTIVERATLADFVPAPDQASAPHDLARALAVTGPAASEHAAELDLPEGIADTALAAVADAGERVERARTPGPLRDPAVLAELAERDLFGASTLEEFIGCSYRWFVSRELRPQAIDPDPDALESGGIVHATLERLFREPPTAERRPTEASCERWIARARELAREVAAERGWEVDAAPASISLARLDAVIARYIRRDAATGGPMMPEAAFLEVRFGDGPDDSFGPADFGSFRLHGAIDRIDVADGRALIRDYKLSSKAPSAKNLSKQGRLQLPLYMLAARGFGLDPIGGLYNPLAATKDDRPRGLLDKEQKGALIPAGRDAHVGTDFFEAEPFEEVLETARREAVAVVDSIRAGRIDRDPHDGACPAWCTLAPVCRIERSIPLPDDEDEDEAAA
ncbi:MAG TPA: PD-(D/E)XK nuclease family protein [Solirubrobacterales bacterium]|nr:PD-(D/E)XK nuclease family protein [Solirubrobacterales bacterium]